MRRALALGLYLALVGCNGKLRLADQGSGPGGGTVPLLDTRNAGIRGVVSAGFQFDSLSAFPANAEDRQRAFNRANLCYYEFNRSLSRWEVLYCEYYPDWARTGNTEITFFDPTGTARPVAFPLSSNGTANRIFLYGADYSGTTPGVHFFLEEGAETTDDAAAPVRIQGRWQRCGYLPAQNVSMCLPYLGMIRDTAANTFEVNWFRRGNRTWVQGYNLLDSLTLGTLDVNLTRYTSPATTGVHIVGGLHAGANTYQSVQWGPYGGNVLQRGVAVHGGTWASHEYHQAMLPMVPGRTRGYRATLAGNGNAAGRYDHMESFEEDR